MRFGLASLSFQLAPHDPRTFPELYADLLRLVEVAEDCGFDSAWVAEHHFSEDGWLPSVMPVAAAMIARTRRIKIGTGIAQAPFYNPLRLAEDAAVLDILSGGRFELGLAIGYRTGEFRAFGIAREERTRRLKEVVEILRLAWRNPPFSFEGKFYTFHDVSVTPKPMRGFVPIPIGGIAEPAVRRAGRIGDGFIASGTLPLGSLAERVKMVRELAAGRPFEVYVPRYCFVWDSADAWDIYLPGYLYDQQLYARWYADDYVEGLYRQGLGGNQIHDLKKAAICGTPDQVIEGIEEMRMLLGNFEFWPRIWVPGMDAKTAERAVRLFGEAVIPHFRINT